MIRRRLLSSLAAGLILAVAPLAQPIQARSGADISVRSGNPGVHQHSFGHRFGHHGFRHHNFRHHDFRFYGYRYPDFRYQPFGYRWDDPRLYPFYGHPYTWYPYEYYPDSEFYFYYDG